MLRVASQLTNQSVVVRMGVVAEWLLPLQHDHRETVRVGFFEVLAHALHGLYRRRLSGSQWAGKLPAPRPQAWNPQTSSPRQRQPSPDDGPPKPAGPPA